MPDVKASAPADSKNLTRAKELYDDLLTIRLQLRNHNHIANSPIPEHKEKIQRGIIANLLIKKRNTEEALNKVSNKLKRHTDPNKDEVVALHRYGRMRQGYAHY